MFRQIRIFGESSMLTNRNSRVYLDKSRFRGIGYFGKSRFSKNFNFENLLRSPMSDRTETETMGKILNLPRSIYQFSIVVMGIFCDIVLRFLASVVDHIENLVKPFADSNPYT